MTKLQQMGRSAKQAARFLAAAGTKDKNQVLNAIADALIKNSEAIVSANSIDIENGEKAGLTKSLIDRLCLTAARVEDMAKGVRDVAALSDPVGEIISGETMANGLKVKKVRVPMGVIGIIFEARPNVTSDAAALCLKAGNACILRGGKEAINSNKAIAKIMREAIVSCGFPQDCVQLIEDTSRETATELMRLDGYLDVLIPRGGAGLIKAVVKNSTVPVIETGVGNCHVYVDKSADIKMAADIIYNAKTSRPSVCNAIETILVHKDIAQQALPVIAEKLSEKDVEIRGCEKTKEILGESVVNVTEDDYYTEFLDYVLACRVVDDLEQAIDHISSYSSGHSECIVTNDYNSQEKFTLEVDSAAVYVNASTRYTDGGELGLGAEIGISTQKLHARGPMGLREMTSFKFIISGQGQIR